MEKWGNQRGSQKLPCKLKMETQLFKIFGMHESISKRDIYSSTGLPQETRKISNKQHKPHPKGIRKRLTIQNQQKERNKIRGDINKSTYTKYSNTQWNQKLFYWKDKENWQTFSESHQEENREDHISNIKENKEEK